MVNLPDSLYEDYSRYKVNFTSAQASTVLHAPDISMIINWIDDLQKKIPYAFDYALQNLITHKNEFEVFPVLLWKSHFTVAMLLQEIVKIYPYISFPVYSQSGMHDRVYNILLLFQCITDHPETRHKFIEANMAHYFYPLMDIDRTDKPLECLRLAALGVIAHMLKLPVDPAVVWYLTDTRALQHCTKAIDIGSEESKSIMSTEVGLQYCCVLPERFFFIDGLLKRLLVYLTTVAEPCPNLFNLVVGCYAKLSYKPRARRGLRGYIPFMLFNGTFASLLAKDQDARNYLQELIWNLEN